MLKFKKYFCEILVLMIAASAFAGCAPTSSEESSVTSSVSSSSVVSAVSETSGIEDKIPAPAVDPSDIASKSQAVPETAVFTVDTALRTKYFDILSRYYSQTLPLIDFESPDKMSTNELVNYAIGITTPLSHPQTSVASMYLFDFLELQHTLQKNLGTQIKYTGNITGFIYNSGNNILYADFVLPSYAYYYRLESLSADANGKYTAVFNVYRDIFTTEDAYNNSLADIKAAITGGTVTTELVNSAQVTITFREMLDSDDSTYLLLMSKSTVKK